MHATLVSDVVTAGNGSHGLVLEMGRAEALVSVSNLGQGVFGSPTNDGVVIVADSVLRANAAEGLRLAIFGTYLRSVIAGNGGTGQVTGGQPLGCNLVGGVRICPP
ncbi:MAG: hypothetical protein MZV70_45435 [Desulfobacterales bacterium]|nr:hypothetical protein [Desulfobacterales bacterium]